jgi:hypothetical protein
MAERGVAYATTRSSILPDRSKFTALRNAGRNSRLLGGIAQQANLVKALR